MNRTIIVVLIAAYKRISVSAEVAELKRSFACDGILALQMLRGAVSETSQKRGMSRE